VPLIRSRATFTKFPFNGSGLRLFDRVEFITHRRERARLQRLRIDRHRPVLAELVQHRTFRCREPHIVTLRLIEKETREREHRVRDRVRLDLVDHTFQRRRMRDETHRHLRQRRGSFARLATLRPVIGPTAFRPPLLIRTSSLGPSSARSSASVALVA
jgi:hypothetical protein